MKATCIILFTLLTAALIGVARYLLNAVEHHSRPLWISIAILLLIIDIAGLVTVYSRFTQFTEKTD